MSTYTISVGSGKATIDKDPEAILDYSLDLTNYLAEINDEVTSLEVLTDGVTLESSNIDGTKVVAWLSGGEVGTTASATFKFTTAGGRIDSRTIFLKIKAK